MQGAPSKTNAGRETSRRLIIRRRFTKSCTGYPVLDMFDLLDGRVLNCCGHNLSGGEGAVAKHKLGFLFCGNSLPPHLLSRRSGCRTSRRLRTPPAPLPTPPEVLRRFCSHSSAPSGFSLPFPPPPFLPAAPARTRFSLPLFLSPSISFWNSPPLLFLVSFHVGFSSLAPVPPRTVSRNVGIFATPGGTAS